MKTLSALILLLLVAAICPAQQIEKNLKPFDRIIASPRINVVLQKGDKEHIKLVYNDVDASKINITVKNKTLHVYLDQARKVEKQVRSNGHGSLHGIYKGVSITAYITYNELEELEIRGQQELTCLGPIENEKFFLKAYGANDITLASLKTEFFKAALYGENELTVKSGKVIEQKYKLFGSNKINANEMKSAFTTTNIFGEGKLSVKSTEEVRVNAFGEPEIEIDGGAMVSKRLIFGKAEIRQR